MSKDPFKFAKNFSLISFSRILEKALSFLFIVVVTRHLGKQGYGQISTVLSFLALFYILQSLGFSGLFVREGSRDKKSIQKYMNNIFSIRIIVSLLLGPILLFVVQNLYSDLTLTVLTGILFINQSIKSLNKTFLSQFQALERMEYEAVEKSLLSVSKIFLGLVYASIGLKVISFSTAWLIPSLLALLFNVLVSYRKFNLPSFEINKEFIRNLLRDSSVFAASGWLVSIYNNIDNIMISRMVVGGTSAVGIYSAPYKLVMGLIAILSSVNTAIYPIMSRKFGENNEESLNLILNKLLKYTLAVAIPIGVGTTLLAKDIVLLIFGSEFANSAPVLQILIWNFVIITAAWPMSTLLKSVDKQVVNLKSSFLEVSGNLIMNLVLIERYELIGAAIATNLTGIIALIYLIYKVRSLGYEITEKMVAPLFKILGGSILMSLLIFYLREYNLVLIITLSGLCYLTCILSLGILDKEDKKTMNNIFSLWNQ